MTTTIRVLAFAGAPNLPIFAARELGFFQKRDLDLEFDTTPSSVFQFEQLSAGNVDIALTAFDNIVAYREGQGAVSLTGRSDFCAFSGATRIALSFVTAPEIRCYEDLKGKTLALDALSTGFAFVLYAMLEQNGLSLHDVEMVAVGSTPDRWRSVKNGTHAGTLSIEPFTSIARTAGFNVLDSSASVVKTYQGGIIAASTSWLDDHHDHALAWLEGYRQGLAWTLDAAHYDEAKELLVANMPAIQPKVADAVMASLLNADTGLTPAGAFLDEGIRSVLELRQRYGGGDSALDDPERYLDRRFG